MREYGKCLGQKNCGTSGCFEKIEIQQQLPEKYFIVFPSASLPVKQWPIERFAEITRRIYKKTGWTLVVCGTKRDAGTIDTFLNEIPEIPVCNMVQKQMYQSL